MKRTGRVFILLFMILSLTVALLTMACVGWWISLHFVDGFNFNLPQIQNDIVAQAQTWIGTEEGSETHLQILDIYNNHEPLARGYAVTVSDNWCATFGSTVAIQLELTDIIPTECGCERQIELWQSLGCWTENDYYAPQPGDYIYYNWNTTWAPKDNTGWSDHVGIVVGTSGPMIKVIEGNKDDQVTYRVICRGDYRIRGFGLPDYASKTE